MDYRDKILAYDNKNYQERLLPKITYNEAVQEMNKKRNPLKEIYLQIITCPVCGRKTANTSDTCWICGMPIFPSNEVEQIELYLCPKSNKCIMDCYHKRPHEKDKYCNDDDECPSCVKELAADITFFPEDFEIE